MTVTSNEYATALFMLASEENCRDKIAEELACVSDIFKENPEYIELLSSPAVFKEERLNMMNRAFSGFHEYVSSLLGVLCEKGHMDEVMNIIDEYSRLVAQTGKITNVVVTSAVELTENETNALREKLEKVYGNTVVIEKRTDSSILGGMIIDADGKVIDASLRKRISEVKDVIGK